MLSLSFVDEEERELPKVGDKLLVRLELLPEVVELRHPILVRLAGLAEAEKYEGFGLVLWKDA